MTNTIESPMTTTTVLSSADLLKHWQAHRDLTRRTINAFPEDKLFTHSIGGMRPFAEMVYEMLGMAVPGATGLATGTWGAWADAKEVHTKAELLALWDEATAGINRIWPSISDERWAQQEVAFGQWPGTCISFIFYFIDNEIHHRGQGFVYLRSLGIEPPSFWERDGL